MKAAIATLAILAASPALAHPGHYAESAGHSHWLAAGALALAFAVAALALRRSRRAKGSADPARKPSEKQA